MVGTIGGLMGLPAMSLGTVTNAGSLVIRQLVRLNSMGTNACAYTGRSTSFTTPRVCEIQSGPCNTQDERGAQRDLLTYNDGVEEGCAVSVVGVLGHDLIEDLTSDDGEVLRRRGIEAELDAW